MWRFFKCLSSNSCIFLFAWSRHFFPFVQWTWLTSSQVHSIVIKTNIVNKSPDFCSVDGLGAGTQSHWGDWLPTDRFNQQHWIGSLKETNLLCSFISVPLCDPLPLKWKTLQESSKLEAKQRKKKWWIRYEKLEGLLVNWNSLVDCLSANEAVTLLMVMERLSSHGNRTCLQAWLTVRHPAQSLLGVLTDNHLKNRSLNLRCEMKSY